MPDLPRQAGDLGISRTGGCQCGAVTYRSTGPALALYICHCRECQRQSASAFGMSLAVARASLSVTTGTPAIWSRTTDSGGTMRCFFCPGCGSRLWHERSAAPEAATIKAGTLDVPPDLADAVHIWTARKLPGTVIATDSRQFPGEPDD